MKPNTIDEQKTKDARAFLNCLIRSQKLMRKNFDSLVDAGISVLGLRDSIQMRGFIRWCELLDMPYTREDWDGNKQCNSDWDIVYFDYKEYRFFELVAKGENE